VIVNRQPLADELPYEFLEPRITPFWQWVGRMYARHQLLRKEQRVTDIEATGLDIIAPLIARGDGVMIAPNHPDHADCGVLLELSGRVRTPFTYMAAYQIFRGYRGFARFLLPRVGAFPVDREGADLKAFRTAVEILAKGSYPLVLFPEGEIYHVCERLTTLREGAAVVATSAAKRAADRGKTVWIVPMALKYRFLDGQDPLPAIRTTMDGLEARFTWWPRRDRSIIARIYAYAEGMLGLKEIEYFGETRPGSIKSRIVGLREAILGHLEDRHFPRRRDDVAPIRVKELRRSCLERLADPKTTPEESACLRRDLHDAFVAVQLFSYPGDYLHDRPTVERIAETVMKFQQDVTGIEAPPFATRKAIAKFGTPIDVRERLVAHAKPRLAAGAITIELEAAIQSLLDAIGPGRSYLDADDSVGGPIGPRIVDPLPNPTETERAVATPQ
jgi:hypothetical protein